MTALDDLLKLPRFGQQGVNERMEKLTAGLEMVPSIKVVGSNGKGTTAHMMAQMALSLGKKVGLYTSPHLLRVGERIQVNGREIQERDLNYILKWALERAAGFEGIGRFEVLTLAALYHFAQSEVDVAIMEVGLGGRFDPVRISPGDLSVLTSVNLEHTAILGNSVEEIATEKAAICKTGDTLISAVGGIETCMPDGVELVDVSTPVLDPLQSNARLAAHAISRFFKLGHLPETFGLKVPGRLHKIKRAPDVYLDVAHNKAAIETVIAHFKDRPISLVCAFQADKEVAGLEYEFHQVIALQFHEGMWAANDLLDQFNAAHKSYVNSVDQALETAIEYTPEDGVILCLGGFEIVGRMLAQHIGVHYDVISL